MAIGDQNDMIGRLQSALPAGWVPSDPAAAPVMYSVISGIAYVLALFYSLYSYVVLQTRIATATDGFLDMIAGDFLGNFLRNANESDASFRARILVQIFRQRATRPALVSLLTELTGNVPTVIEPRSPGDTGAYGVGAGGRGYGAGFYGSELAPYQCFVIAYRPASIGVPNVPGYGDTSWGFGFAGAYDAAGSLLNVSDLNIFNAIDSVRPIGTVVWVSLQDA